MSAHMQRLELQTNPLYCKIFLFSSITLTKWESIPIPCLLSKINVFETGKLIQLLGFSLHSHLVINNIKQHCTWSHLYCPSLLLSSFRHRQILLEPTKANICRWDHSLPKWAPSPVPYRVFVTQHSSCSLCGYRENQEQGTGMDESLRPPTDLGRSKLIQACFTKAVSHSTLSRGRFAF